MDYSSFTLFKKKRWALFLKHIMLGWFGPFRQFRVHWSLVLSIFWKLELYATQYGVLSLICHQVTVCWDIKIQQTSERTYSCRIDSSTVILSHSNFVHSCPESSNVTLSHLILSCFKSLKLFMFEVHQCNIRYTVTQWWLPPSCAPVQIMYIELIETAHRRT
jgi:hypothetical protein